MKCLPFIITLFLGRFIDVQGENNVGYGSGDGPLFRKIPEENPLEEPDSEDLEYPFEAETENPLEESEQSSNDDMFDINVDDSTEAESSEQESHWKMMEKKQSGDGLKSKENSNDEEMYKHNQETVDRFFIELNAGDSADLIGQNQHIEQSNVYLDLGRRFEAQALKNIAGENVDYLTPEKAPPELVLLVAKESALLRAGKDLESDFDRKKILRSGDYWNGVWKEKVNPKSAMRSTSQKKRLGSIKAKINPGTELYKVVSRMKNISPQLLYIINKKQP